MRFMYLWQSSAWPRLTYDVTALNADVTAARLAQGRMLGLAGSLGLVDVSELQLAGWAQEAFATAQIEGETLQIDSVRASAARRLGLASAREIARDPRVEATLDVLEAAVARLDEAVSPDDLFAWHAALFPTGRSGVTRIRVGGWRTHEEPMQIVTERPGKPDVVHFQAPASPDVPALMDDFLNWFNATAPRHDASSGGGVVIDGLVRAALAHLWFETVHPFEDGNGRIGRALAELALAQDMRSQRRLFSLSAQLWQDRAGYYAELQNATGRGEMDVTAWVRWFVGRIQAACDAAVAHMQTALTRNRYWSEINARHGDLDAAQRKCLARLLEAGPGGFVGGMSTEKYVALTGVSRATAYRDLTDLTERGLVRRTGQGRGTRYELAPAESGGAIAFGR